jgi:lipopolysaccharide export system protein LptA
VKLRFLLVPLAALATGVIALAKTETSTAPTPATEARTSDTTNAAPASVTFTHEAAPATTTVRTNRTEITSKQLRMDTEKRTAYFDGDVLVDDPQFQLRANRLVVYLKPNDSGMSHAEAFEDVVIVQESEKRRAYCQKAVYTTEDGKIVLTGNPRLEGDRGVTTGEVITIFRQNNTVLIEGGTRTTIDLGLQPPAKTNAPPEEAATTNAPPPAESN